MQVESTAVVNEIAQKLHDIQLNCQENNSTTVASIFNQKTFEQPSEEHEESDEEDEQKVSTARI